jgi:hypothetical protein
LNGLARNRHFQSTMWQKFKDSSVDSVFVHSFCMGFQLKSIKYKLMEWHVLANEHIYWVLLSEYFVGMSEEFALELKFLELKSGIMTILY